MSVSPRHVRSPCWWSRAVEVSVSAESRATTSTTVVPRPHVPAKARAVASDGSPVAAIGVSAFPPRAATISRNASSAMRVVSAFIPSFEALTATPSCSSGSAASSVAKP